MRESQIGRDRWWQVSRLFDEAFDLAPERRAAFLRDAAADDELLCREVEELLTAADASESFLEGPAQPAPEAGPPREELAPGTRLGAWRIERLLGRGGMGEVYLAERADGRYEQRAAIKLLQPEAIAMQPRFEVESRILARLEHPGIARLYDAGVAPDGRPYMVMEYVVGQPLGSWSRRPGLDLTARLRLFLEVCAAVAYAHTNLVVHRDLKPANILVTADGRAKLLDFGIGKLLEADGSASATMPMAGLTPEYAAPEQLAGQPVTTATDTYALGVLLYELLTGRRPWAGESVARILHASLHEEPPPPSASVSRPERPRRGPVGGDGSVPSAGGSPPVPPRLLRGDLDAIVAACLRKEPQQRYGTVNALALDVQRHLRGEPIAARAHGHLYVLGRVLRRHRLAVAAALALLLALGAGLGGTLWQASVARQQAAQARHESQHAQATRDFLVELFAATDPDVARGDPPGALDLLNEGARRVRQGAFEEVPELRGEMLGLLGDLYRKIGQYDAARPLLAEALRRVASGGDAVGHADALFRLGTLEMEDGRHDRALEALERAERLLAAAGLVPSRRHGLLVEQKTITLGEMGRGAEAAERAEAALALARAAPRLPPEALYRYLFSLGSALLEIEQHERAEPLFSEALALKVAAAEAPSNRLALHAQLATTREHHGDRATGIEHRRAALALADQIYPPVHRERARMLNDLGSSVLSHGRPDEAEIALREALAILGELYPDGDHVGVAAVLHNLGQALIDGERYEEAEPYLRRGRELTGELLGREDVRYAASSATLGSLLGRLERFREAEVLMHEALDVYREAGGPEHHLVAQTLGRLANVFLAESRPLEALDLADRALALYRRIGHENPERLVTVHGFRARALAQLGRNEEARTAFEEAIAVGERTNAEVHAGRQWARLLARYAQFLVDRGAAESAAAVARALELHRETFGDHHPATRRLVALTAQ